MIFLLFSSHSLAQHAVIQGTVTAIKLMSVNSRRGNGAVVINVSSMAGELVTAG